MDVRLLVHARNRAELVERFPTEKDRFYFAEDTWLHRMLFRFGQRLPPRLAEATSGLLIHITTQMVQRRQVRDLVSQFKINVIHQPIPVSPKSPSLMYGFNAPVLIGPLNGGMEYPPAFRTEQGKLATTAMALGRLIAELFNMLFPGKRLAGVILVANRRTREALPWGVRGRVVELVENGVDLSIWRRKHVASRRRPRSDWSLSAASSTEGSGDPDRGDSPRQQASRRFARDYRRRADATAMAATR